MSETQISMCLRLFIIIDYYAFIYLFYVLGWSVELYPIHAIGCICQGFYSG